VQAHAAAEINTVLAGRAPTPDDLPALPWLTATLKEAMRLHPPIAALMTRRLSRELVLGGVRLPARTMVRITPWLLHRDPRSWPREPEAFRPERFLDGAPDPIPRGAYLPFGQGPRVCLGQHFSMLEMTLIAALLLQRFSLAPLSATPPQAKLAVTLRPVGGLRLRLAARA
jgi:cytochrome P450